MTDAVAAGLRPQVGVGRSFALAMPGKQDRLRVHAVMGLAPSGAMPAATLDPSAPLCLRAAPLSPAATSRLPAYISGFGVPTVLGGKIG